MSPSEAPPDDCFRELDEQFDEVCWWLGQHGVDPDDVEALAREILVLTWRRCGHREPPWPLAPLDEIAALVASDYLERRRHDPHGR
jgi:hypothetical protein